jgi:hypothetical protein
MGGAILPAKTKPTDPYFFAGVCMASVVAIGGVSMAWSYWRQKSGIYPQKVL